MRTDGNERIWKESLHWLTSSNESLMRSMTSCGGSFSSSRSSPLPFSRKEGGVETRGAGLVRGRDEICLLARLVEVGVKEGLRETGRERVRHEGRHPALAGDEDARPGGWWPGRRLRPA